MTSMDINFREMKEKASAIWRPYNRGLSQWRRVIASLIFREAKTTWGEKSLGIVWAFIEPISHIIVLSFLKIALMGGVSVKGDMPMVLFLASGLYPFFMFRNTFTKVTNCIDANRALLVFPQIHIFDFILARSILELMTYGCSFFFFVITYSWIFGGFELLSIQHILSGFLFIWLMGMGIGMIILPINKKFKFVDDFISVILRLLYFLSGIMFSFTDAPPNLREYFTYLPTFHAVEYVRSGFAHVFGSHVDVGYMAEISIVLCMVGLFIIRKYNNYILNVRT